jgi:DNA-binding LytR/AlgR family response regulator
MTLHLKYSSNEIAFLEANENYTNVYMKNGEQLLSSYTLLRHEKKLKGFIRVSRRYLINPEYIKEYKLDRPIPHMVLKSGEEIRIPRRRVKEFLS